MKIRLTVLTENDCPRPNDLTEEKVMAAWQIFFGMFCLASDNNDKYTIEKVEFVEDVSEVDDEPTD